ncbi:MAG: anti-sigma factor antagonist [Halanaerobium sp.]|nr:anti-sigma factor antagonist [Halanaerobium sp.]
MKFTEEVVSKDALKLQLAGDMDAHSADELRNVMENILDRGNRPLHLFLDLEGVEFIDSSGLGIMLGRYRKLSQRKGMMVVINPQPHVRRILELAGIERIIPIVGDLGQALDLVGEKEDEDSA